MLAARSAAHEHGVGRGLSGRSRCPPSQQPRHRELTEHGARLVAGEAVTVHGFGTFDLRDKRARLGRNPRTGEEAPILARRDVSFRASAKLRKRVADGMAEARQDAQALQ